jgi:uncharacterized membrane protein YcaP (DUF421 family)
VVLGLSATRAEQLSILQCCDRAIVVYVVLIVYVRIGKKRFLGGATAFYAILVIIIIIGSIASRAISAPFVPSLAATLVLILFHWLISLIVGGSRLFSNLVKGHDTSRMARWIRPRCVMLICRATTWRKICGRLD